MLNRNFTQATDIGTLKIKKANGRYREATQDEIIEAAKALIGARFSKETAITQPKETFDFLQLQLAGIEHEIFAVLWMDAKHRPLAFEELFTGTIDGASIYPREVVKSALAHNAASAILCHNHPSGETKPSMADEQITQKLKAALDLVDVRVIDHVVVGEKTSSFAELGIL
jgi:DNA repair protein RadC